MKPPYHSVHFWLGMLATIALVVGVRELALFVCTLVGMPTATNIVGLVTLFVLLIMVRQFIGLPTWLTQSASVLLVDSGFAFLPVSAGAGILLFGLGEELIFVCIIIVVSVVLPLWLFAKLSEQWLKQSD